MADGVLIQAKGNPSRTKSVRERDAKILVRLGRWEYPTTALDAGPPRRAKRKRPTAEPETVALAPPPTEGPEAGLNAEAPSGRDGSEEDDALTKVDTVAITKQDETA